MRQSGSAHGGNRRDPRHSWAADPTECRIQTTSGHSFDDEERIAIMLAME